MRYMHLKIIAAAAADKQKLSAKKLLRRRTTAMLMDIDIEYKLHHFNTRTYTTDLTSVLIKCKTAFHPATADWTLVIIIE